jgi:penicillin-binding protein 1C
MASIRLQYSIDFGKMTTMKVRRPPSRKVSFRRSRRRRLAKARLLTLLSGMVFFGLVLTLFISTAVFAWVGRDLPSPDRLTEREVELSTKIYDRNGKLLFDIYADQNRSLVTLDQIPAYLKEATIAIEDKNFYRHQGLAPRGIARAIFEIVVHRRLQGGSTLTQQLIKNTLLTPERTLTRKIREIILAIQVERRYSKDQILQMYLNEVPYGGSYWGVAAAAQGYFGKEVPDLSLAESAILAGLPQKPTAYSPCGQNPDAFKGRAAQVLRRMREDGYIDVATEERAKNQIEKGLLGRATCRSSAIKAPHFVMFVRNLLVEQFGERMVETGGLRVTTTLDLDLQEDAQRIVSEEIAKLAAARVGNGGAIVTDPGTGEILAMVGSKDYFAQDYEGKYNVVFAQRQPGSAMKPVVYAAAFEKGYTPATVIMDVPTEFPTGDPERPIYKPVNYDGIYRGPVQIRFALGSSINIPAVKMGAMVGTKEIMKKAYEMGASSWEPTPENLKKVGLSLPLGGREISLADMAVVYGTLANRGRRQDLVALLKVEDASGKVIFAQHPVPGREVVRPGIAYLITHILLDNEARKPVFGPNSYLNLNGLPVAVKTGTTDEKRDNWTIGYTSKALVGVWVGNNDNSPMDPVVSSGTTGASPIWRRIMLRVLKDRPAEWPVQPDDVKAYEVDALTGMRPSSDDQPKRTEFFLVGTEPEADTIRRKVKFSKNQPDKLANEIEIARGEYEEKLRYVFTETDPVSTDGKNRWQEGINEWARSQGDERFLVPTETSDAHLSGDESIWIGIKNPPDESRVDGEVEIKADVVAVNEVVKVIFEIDGAEKKSLTSEPYAFKYDFRDESEGKHTIKARAQDSLGNENSAEVKISVKTDFTP